MYGGPHRTFLIVSCSALIAIACRASDEETLRALDVRADAGAAGDPSGDPASAGAGGTRGELSFAATCLGYCQAYAVALRATCADGAGAGGAPGSDRDAGSAGESGAPAGTSEFDADACFLECSQVGEFLPAECAGAFHAYFGCKQHATDWFCERDPDSRMVWAVALDCLDEGEVLGDCVENHTD